MTFSSVCGACYLTVSLPACLLVCCRLPAEDSSSRVRRERPWPVGDRGEYCRWGEDTMAQLLGSVRSVVACILVFRRTVANIAFLDTCTDAVIPVAASPCISGCRAYAGFRRGLLRSVGVGLERTRHGCGRARERRVKTSTLFVCIVCRCLTDLIVSCRALSEEDTVSLSDFFSGVVVRIKSPSTVSFVTVAESRPGEP